MAPKESQPDKDITLVRGADGALYLINKARTPLKLKGDKEHQVTEILKDAEKKLTEIIRKDQWFTSLSCTSNVHVKVPEVFP